MENLMINRKKPLNIGIVSDNKTVRNFKNITSKFGNIILPISSDILAEDNELSDSIWKNLDGIILPGGKSVTETRKYYDSPRDPQYLDYIRDFNWEIIILKSIKKQIPMLTTCRGTLVLNVALGGTLKGRGDIYKKHSKYYSRKEIVTDDEKRIFKQGRYKNFHNVKILKNTKLSEILFGEDNKKDHIIKTNSNHTYAIDKVNELFEVSAISTEDGIIEGIEPKNKELPIISVQWHPEIMFSLTNGKSSFKLFNNFFKLSSEYQKRKE